MWKIIWIDKFENTLSSMYRKVQKLTENETKIRQKSSTIVFLVVIRYNQKQIIMDIIINIRIQ